MNIKKERNSGNERERENGRPKKSVRQIDLRG